MKTISLTQLSIMLIPLVLVGGIYWKWLGARGEIAVAALRMVTQLLLIGFVLNWIFANNRLDFALAILGFMIVASSVIARRNHSRKGVQNYLTILVSIFIGGSFNLILVIVWVMQPKPLYSLETLIPLAGMIYANGMNTVSLAGERFWKLIDTGKAYVDARNESFRAALIPQINSFLAVGLVSLPGMMTGQVLSGVSPIVAVRYQIVVMCMILGTAGMSVATYLYLSRKQVAEQ